MPRPKFPRPSFKGLSSEYLTNSKTVHACSIFAPGVDSGVFTCAARMSEALVIANRLIRAKYQAFKDPFLNVVLGAGDYFATEHIQSRVEIAKLGDGRGDGQKFLLGTYGYGSYACGGKLCPHGIGRGPGDLAAFLKYHWGARTQGWTAQASETSAPKGIQGKNGIIAYLKIPGYDGQGHIDLWEGDHPVGDQYWNAATNWFWELA